MTTKISLTYFGMDGEGRTVTEAKKDAGAKIEAALSGSYTPEVVTWRGIAALVYREPTGWYTRLIADEERGIIAGPVWGTNYGSREEALASAQLNVAQCGWRAEDGETIPEFLGNGKSRAGRNLHSEFTSWVRFQLRCVRARQAGCTPEEIHSYGCYSFAPTELVDRIDAWHAAQQTA